MDNLIIKYLNDELNAREWKDLQRWLDEDENHKMHFNKLVAYWKNTNGASEKAKEKILRKVESGFIKSDISVHPKKKYHLIRIAASLLLICLLSFLFYELGHQMSSGDQAVALFIEKETNPGQRLTTKLPDGSTVILNSSTKLKFPEKFDQSERVVELEGEAFFEVEHEETRPFLVKSNGSVVRVLGTTFNVRTYAENSINVAVATGKVSFTPPNVSKGVILSPNQMISYTAESDEMIVKDVDVLDVFGWKDRVLFFKDEDLGQIIKELERWYGVKVTTEKDFSYKGKFTGEFKNKSLENVLIGLSYLYEFDFRIKNDTVKLK